MIQEIKNPLNTIESRPKAQHSDAKGDMTTTNLVHRPLQVLRWIGPTSEGSTNTPHYTVSE